MLKPNHSYRHDPHRAHVHAPEESHDPMPLPSELWAQANGEHPKDVGARQARYLELMIDAGHIEPVDAE